MQNIKEYIKESFTFILVLQALLFFIGIVFIFGESIYTFAGFSIFVDYINFINLDYKLIIAKSFECLFRLFIPSLLSFLSFLLFLKYGKIKNNISLYNSLSTIVPTIFFSFMILPVVLVKDWSILTNWNYVCAYYTIIILTTMFQCLCIYISIHEKEVKENDLNIKSLLIIYSDRVIIGVQLIMMIFVVLSSGVSSYGGKLYAYSNGENLSKYSITQRILTKNDETRYGLFISRNSEFYYFIDLDTNRFTSLSVDEISEIECLLVPKEEQSAGVKLPNDSLDELVRAYIKLQDGSIVAEDIDKYFDKGFIFKKFADKPNEIIIKTQKLKANQSKHLGYQVDGLFRENESTIIYLSYYNIDDIRYVKIIVKDSKITDVIDNIKLNKRQLTSSSREIA